MSLVELSRHMHSHEAEIIRGRLEAAGIGAVCFDSGVNIVEGAGIALPARVMVLAEDLNHAKLILAEDVSL
ncbi:DUF2007 domain-containing protein [Parasphingorhabdus sp. JC815]|uniref:putative signal transducing protein n=1 Tax=Parasphingorhabdus sp. JC815 TaxID=3232140 RepID=UPI0034590DA4